MSLAEVTRSAVAVVGSRAATSYGIREAGSLGAELADLGMTIVSGAAFGVDQAAHRGALAVGVSQWRCSHAALIVSLLRHTPNCWQRSGNGDWWSQNVHPARFLHGRGFWRRIGLSPACARELWLLRPRSEAEC